MHVRVGERVSQPSVHLSRRHNERVEQQQISRLDQIQLFELAGEAGVPAVAGAGGHAVNRKRMHSLCVLVPWIWQVGCVTRWPPVTTGHEHRLTTIRSPGSETNLLRECQPPSLYLGCGITTAPTRTDHPAQTLPTGTVHANRTRPGQRRKVFRL